MPKRYHWIRILQALQWVNFCKLKPNPSFFAKGTCTTVQVSTSNNTTVSYPCHLKICRIRCGPPYIDLLNVGFYGRLDPIYRINHSSGPVVNVFLANTVLRRCKLKKKALMRCYAYSNWAIPSQGGGVPRECNGNWGRLWNRRPAGICVHKVSWLNKASFFFRNSFVPSLVDLKGSFFFFDFFFIQV